MLERFFTFSRAVKSASARCANWRDIAAAGSLYSISYMTGMAQAADSEDPLDEDGFYAVSPAGAIGISSDGEEITWLYISASAPNEELPTQYQTAPRMNFCPGCGLPTIPGAHFCSKCGGRVS